MNDENNKILETNKKKNSIIMALVCIIVILLVGYGVYIYFDDIVIHNNKTDTNSNTSSETEVTKEDVFNFVILDSNEDENKDYLYLASNDYFNYGTKSLVSSSKKIYDVKILNNKIYYINSDDLKSLIVYDIKTSKIKKYSISSDMSVNYNTEILPGTKYTIISNGTDFLAIDLDNNTNTKIKVNNNRGSGIFDSDNNTLYYSYNSAISGINIVTNEKVEISGAKGYPLYIDDNKIYIDGENGEADVFYALDRKSLKLEKLNIKDYSTGVSSIPTVNSIGNELFITFNDSDKLTKYSNNVESYLIEKDYLKYYVIGNSIYIASASLVCDDICSPGSFNTYYKYDLKTQKLNEINNEYVKKLFDAYAVYNVK